MATGNDATGPDGPSTLVLLPTYQEAENVLHVLRRIRAAVPAATVLVIDDASPDGTADLAEREGERTGMIEVLRRPCKDGLGSAYRAGARWALENGFDVIVLIDADLSHDPDALPGLLSAMADHDADLVLGSRYIPGGSIVDWPLSRRLLSSWGNTYVRLALGLPIHDATTGYRIWRAAAIKEVLLDTEAEGYGFVIESNFRAARTGHRIVEVPIVFRERERGRSKMSLQIIFEALRMVTVWAVQERAGRLRRRPAALDAGLP
ncbi:MAG TPA: polyprenol monophosphomannose synthase [Acidimicrobiales bacterium]|nr:polyprenol monophosphomannose synthase [Acidimicrobiales bacterium]